MVRLNPMSFRGYIFSKSIKIFISNPRYFRFIWLFCVLVSGFLLGSCINWIKTCRPSTKMIRSTADTYNNHIFLTLDPPDHPHQEQTFLVILILSAKHHRERRDACRNTWLKLADGRLLKHYFVLGGVETDAGQLESIELEQKNYRDILMFPQVKDSYSGLTQKLLAAIKWVDHKFSASFLLKVDDDSFVALDRLFDELIQMRDATRLYWGYFAGAAPVQKRGQWAERGWFLCDRYLPYAVGGGYLLSHDLLQYISNNFLLLQPYVSEDVSVGTWLSPLKINRLHDVRFDTWHKSRGCSNSFLISHKQTPGDMMNKYENLKSIGTMCQIENFIPGHVYNWTVAPSKCCERNH